MFDSCSSPTVINRSIITDSDEVEIRITNIEGQSYKMSWRNAVDTDTDSMNYMDIHPPGKHLHFPFNETAHCSNHTKTRDNNKQIEGESVTFPYIIGYGYRRTAWWMMNNGYLNLPATNELHIGEEIEIIDNNENEIIDDPRRGARTLESNQIYSGSRILLTKESYQDEDDINGSDTDDVSVLEEKVNNSVEPQGPEIMRKEEFYEETFAKHISHRFIDTENF